MKKISQGKIFYGWYIVVVSSLISAMTIGIMYNCYGLFVVPVCTELNFPRQAMAMTQTILSLCGLGVSLLAGKLFTRQRTMLLMRVAAVATPLLYGAYSLVTAEWMLYPIAVLSGIGYMLLTHLPLSVIISNWFDKKRGFALGFAMMGSGVGGMIFNMLTGWLLEVCGWRITYQILAAAIFVVCVPCVFFVVRFCPEDMGLLPYGSKEEISSSVQEYHESEGPMFSEVCRTPKFWLLCIMLMLTGFSNTQISQTMSPRMLDTGYSVTVTAAVTSISMAVLAVGKVIVGRWFDRFGPLVTETISCIFIFGLAVGLLFSGWHVMVVLIVFGFGIGCAYGSVVAPAMTQSLYGRRDYATIYGVVNALTSAGGIFGPMVSAAIFDFAGSYNPAYFMVMGCIVVIILIGFYVLRQPKQAK